MKLVPRVLIVIGCLLLIPVTAVVTAAAKQRFTDGANRLFSGGPLVAGELQTGPEPDWSFVKDIPTIELQLLDPPRSRRIWTAEHDGKLYVWSGYMGTFVGRVWKQLAGPGRAGRPRRAPHRRQALRAAARAHRVGSDSRRHRRRHRRQVPVTDHPGGGRGGQRLGVRGGAPPGVRAVERRGSPMRNFYWCIAAALVLTVLAVLFMPGVDDFVERTFQGYVGRAAR